ncbi:TlpA family protein disulfide reductase [Arsenicicoccus piscis]|uniref:Thioredoxin domain-containing protein n=1 Tax=Arsenicicoccus piscis TaxID=673954 RepID=A0ABQ6HJI8_9MICO|nr:TlpA disulfide reductase family protein [Arsenicicoccus piscis]MCH8627694.1 TlpA family protein disulfide reductase [Arsenicicoccus piscis]GMA18197.1 hypothetical protein GCM10025862_02180 [Arsenicicoccus piscis]
MTIQKASAALLALGVAVVLTGCSEDPNSVSAQAKSGDEKGYITTDGTIETLPVDKRGAPVDLAGTTLDGKTWSLADQRGTVVVLNAWASWCPPCEAEQPDLTKVWDQVQAAKKPVQFMGVVWRGESTENALTWSKEKKVTYPSLANDGRTILALGGKVPSPPTTIVVDKQGRMAARILGRTTATTLSDVIDDVIKSS